MKIDSVEMIHKNGNVLGQPVALPLKRKSLLILNNNSVIVKKNPKVTEDEITASESNDDNNNDYVDHSNDEDDDGVAGETKFYDNDFKCPVCSETSLTVEALEEHLKQHPNYKPTCNQCGEVFADVEILIKHTAMHVTDKCAIRNNQINLKILNYLENKNTIYQKLAETIDASQSYRCNFCNELFIGSHFMTHWKQCKHFQSDDSNSKLTNSDESYNADKSPKDGSLADENEEAEEMKSHFLAGLNLQSKSDRLSDDGSSPEKCDLVAKLSGKDVSSYPKHPAFKDDDLNDDDDPFKLEVRDMKRRGEFPCRICKKIFRNLRALKGHARIHISGNRGIMPYECNICSFTTSDKSVVIRHIRNHNGDHPYKCQLCFSTFTTKANCERHLRNAHRKTSREDIKKLLVDLNHKTPNNNNNTTSGPNFNNKLQTLLTNNKKPNINKLLAKKIPEEFAQSFCPEDFYRKVNERLEHSEDEKSVRMYDDGNISFNDRSVARSDADDSNNSNDSNNNTNAAGIMNSCKKMEDFAAVNPILLAGSDYKYPTFHLPGGLDMRLSKSEKQFYEANYKSYNDAIVGSGLIPTIIKDNGFIKVPCFENTFVPNGVGGCSSSSDHDEPLDLSVDVLDLSKKKDDAGGDDSAAEDLSVKTCRESFSSEKSETTSPIRKPPAAVNPLLVGNMNQSLFFAKDDLRYNFPNNHQMVTNFSSYFMQNPAVNLFSNNLKLEPEDDHAKIRPLIFSHLVANAAERYEGIRPNVPPFVDFTKKPDPSVNEEISHHHNEKIAAADNAKFNHTKDMPVKPRNNKSSTVKMVMKDGVLVEKQKQRRYRTEKPFSCAYCSGRFTLRSNMDRHVKQQHPGFWRQRQRGGSTRQQRTKHTKEESNSESAAFPSTLTSDIVSEQETTSHDTDYPMNPIVACGKRSPSYASDHEADTEDNVEKCKKKKSAEDVDNSVCDDDDDDDEELVIDEEMDEHESEEKSCSEPSTANTSCEKDTSSSVKEENPDLASVRSLLDNVSTQTFSQYFRPEDDPNNKNGDGSDDDEEGLVAGSSSEGNGSGGEENRASNESNSKNANKSTPGDGTKKKKSAYSSAPNRVHCDFCYRSFPWASSLRRHTLTHTGQKPYKCSNCPLLFTTKSNCDRHFLRKHRSQMNDSNQPSTVTVISNAENDASSSSTRLIPNFSMRNVPERPFKCSNCPSSTFSTYNNLKKHIIEKHNQSDEKLVIDNAKSPSYSNDSPTKCSKKEDISLSDTSDVSVVEKPTQGELPKEKSNPATVAGAAGYDQAGFFNHVSSDLPFKCHLCDRSFGERQEALDHMGESHSVEFQHLICKGALDMNVKMEDSINHEDGMFMSSANSDENNAEQCRGRFPDYSSRKVICAFCLRRFWSAEDLRRHMRTHTGERPFACDICQRRFTLKHSMLRHRKKHSNKSSSFVSTSGENSPISDDEEPPSPGSFTQSMNRSSDEKASELISISHKLMKSYDSQDANDVNSNFFPNSDKEAKTTETTSKLASVKTNLSKEDGVDLIAKLLDIDDKSLVDEMLTSKSADDVAKLLGVKK
ncbi:uncharacterized protein LOC135836100 [Planococcus citri]|uniref:uncharacterized protein LOC135836100 n=1 Tax=Planococcus citri TaxID=170843 RepID=UPI0031F93B90